MSIDVKKSRFSFWKLFLLLFATAAIVIILGLSIALKDFRGVSLSQSVTVDIPEGAGSSVVADMLSENNVIKYPSIFKLASRLGGYDGDYKPGVITISDNESYTEILSALTKSERDSVTVVIPEGYTIKQIAGVLSDNGLCSTDDFYNALDPSLYDYDFLKNLPERSEKLEGYLFPATYEIMPNISAREIVKMMLEQFNTVFNNEYRQRANEMGMSFDEVITMASVIERETNSDAERAKVAGVFYNRLNSDMKLESCATVQYILGENKPVLSVADTRIESPYNTYIHTGLPIGPICSPGEECIKAALYPEKIDAFYFLLGKNGEHIFSKTYEEHKKAMEENGL